MLHAAKRSPRLQQRKTSMKTRTKLIGLAAAAALAAAAGTYAATASAQEHKGSGPSFMHGAGFQGMMGMHRGAMSGPFADEGRLDALKKELGITAAQEPAWAAYAKTVQETAAALKARHDGIDMGKMHAMSDKERAATMAGMREQAQKSLQAVKAAAETLVAALDETQKAKARESLPGLRAAGPGMMAHQGTRGPGMMGPGMMGPGMMGPGGPQRQ
jgi:hypothetical protein